MQQYASNPQALQVLKRSSSSTSNSPLIVKKSCVIKSGLGRPNTDLILVNKAGRPVSLSLVKSKKMFFVTLGETRGGQMGGGPTGDGHSFYPRIASQQGSWLWSDPGKALHKGGTITFHIHREGQMINEYCVYDQLWKKISK